MSARPVHQSAAHDEDAGLGKGPVTNLSVLHGDFWPEEESIEDFLAALHEWRGHKKAGPAA
jgi:hypothetical protein